MTCNMFTAKLQVLTNAKFYKVANYLLTAALMWTSGFFHKEQNQTIILSCGHKKRSCQCALKSTKSNYLTFNAKTLITVYGLTYWFK